MNRIPLLLALLLISACKHPLADTLIIFLGDNGTPGNVIVEEPGLPFDQRHGKSTMYEGGILVPMIISGGAKMGINATERVL